MKKTEFINELRSLPLNEVQDRVRTLSQSLMKLRFRKASGQLDQGHLLREEQRNLARAKTVLAEKQRETAAVSE